MTTENLFDRYQHSLLPVFGRPQLVLSRGDGAYVWDSDGKRYLDLLGGIAVNVLGHGHPAIVSAVSKQASEAIHISNFFASEAQITLAEKLLKHTGAPEGSRVFFTNSGTESIEAAIKLARRTGRTGIVAAVDAFHGRSTGALALTYKKAYRQPFEPLLPGVTHVRYDDVDALRAAVDENTSAIVLEPIQGEAGVVSPSRGYLSAAREIATAAGALLIIDEIQTGIGRTGDWFAFQYEGIVPDAITVAKALGGGVPIGALITFGEHASGLINAGQHGTTFGGNPLACAAGNAVIDTIVEQDLLAAAIRTGDHLATRIESLGLPLVDGVQGRGLLRAIRLADAVAPAVAAAALEAGFIVNPVNPGSIRLAPPLILTIAEADEFVDALPTILRMVKTP